MTAKEKELVGDNRNELTETEGKELNEKSTDESLEELSVAKSINEAWETGTLKRVSGQKKIGREKTADQPKDTLLVLIHHYKIFKKCSAI